MTLKISTATDVAPKQLRNLVTDNLVTLLGDGARPWKEMAGLGDHCLLATDAADELTLISFHPEEPGQALLAGLSWMDQLRSDVAALFLRDYRKPSRLLVLTPGTLPGAETLRQCGEVQSRSFQILSVNDELGLFLEPTTARAPEKPAFSFQPDARSTKSEAKEPALSSEEEEFFGQM
jgi:hypothetical protein